MHENHIKRTFFEQQGSSDCGPACLASIIGYYDGNVSIDEIRQITGTTKTGTKLLGLYHGAKQLGFHATGLQAEAIESLHELDGPAILHVVLENQMQHYVVFYGFKGDHLIIGDPAKGILLWKKEQLLSVWHSKYLLKLSYTENLQNQKTKSNNYTQLFQWIKEDINILTSAIFLGFLIAILSLSTAIFSQKLIDNILPSKEIPELILGLTLFGLVLFLKACLGFARSTFLITQSRDFNERIIGYFFRSLLELPKPFFDSKKTGEMIARMNDTGKIQVAISNLTGNMMIEILLVISCLFGVFFYAWQVGFLLVFFLPSYLGILWRLNPPIVLAQKDVMTKYALNEGNYIDVISGIPEIKVTGTANLFYQSTNKFYQGFQKCIYNLNKIQTKLNFRTELASLLLLICVISLSAYFVIHDQLSMGSLKLPL